MRSFWGKIAARLRPIATSLTPLNRAPAAATERDLGAVNQGSAVLVRFCISDQANRILLDHLEGLSNEAQAVIKEAPHESADGGGEPRCVFHCSRSVASELRAHFEKLEGKFRKFANSAKARTCHLAGAAIAQDST